MNLAKTVLLARDLMDQHGLREWLFRYDRARRRAGCCKYGRRTITLSIHYVERNEDAQIRDTILHEIAHALAGPKAKHGPEWKTICCQIGARPVRCYDATVVDMPKGKYQAVCRGCQKTYHRHRKMRAGRWSYCRKCGPELGRLEYRLFSQNSPCLPYP